MYPDLETNTLQAADPPQHVPEAPVVMLKQVDPEATKPDAVVFTAAVVVTAAIVVTAAVLVAAAVVVADEETQAFVT